MNPRIIFCKHYKCGELVKKKGDYCSRHQAEFDILDESIEDEIMKKKFKGEPNGG